MKISYKWLQTYFSDPLPDPEEVSRLLEVHSFEIEEIIQKEEDTIIDVDVLPNRAADCLSHRGIAREISAVLARAMNHDELTQELPDYSSYTDIHTSVDKDVPNTRVAVAYIRNVVVKESPDWLKKQLAALGQRSINNIVDATNYVMLQTGQPLHAFDARVFKGDVPHVRIRKAEEGTPLTLLGGHEVTLTSEDLVVADGNTGMPLDIAGVRGGKKAEVHTETTDIVLTSSHFDPTMVRKSAQRLKIWTDAAKRMQNNPALLLTEHGLKEGIELVLDIAGGSVEGVARAGVSIEAPSSITLSLKDINNLLGTSLTSTEVRDICERLEMECKEEGDTFKITPPWQRQDLHIAEDIIEEVGRLYGYENLPKASLPEAPIPEVPTIFWVEETIREVLTVEGFSEVYTYSLVNRGDVALANALNTEKNHLRNDLYGSLEEVLKENKKYTPLFGEQEVQVFEIGNIFANTEEKKVLGIASTQKKVSFANIEEKLSGALGVSVHGITQGQVHQIDLSEVIDTVLVGELPPCTPLEVSFVPPSVFPFITRDVAVWTPENTSQKEVEESIQKKAGELLRRLDCFDTYTKEGRTSYAFRLVFQSDERTLEDAEIQHIMDAVYSMLTAQEGFEIR